MLLPPGIKLKPFGVRDSRRSIQCCSSARASSAVLAVARIRAEKQSRETLAERIHQAERGQQAAWPDSPIAAGLAQVAGDPLGQGASCQTHIVAPACQLFERVDDIPDGGGLRAADRY